MDALVLVSSGLHASHMQLVGLECSRTALRRVWRGTNWWWWVLEAMGWVFWDRWPPVRCRCDLPFASGSVSVNKGWPDLHFVTLQRASWPWLRLEEKRDRYPKGKLTGSSPNGRSEIRARHWLPLVIFPSLTKAPSASSPTYQHIPRPIVQWSGVRRWGRWQGAGPQPCRWDQNNHVTFDIRGKGEKRANPTAKKRRELLYHWQSYLISDHKFTTAGAWAISILILNYIPFTPIPCHRYGARANAANAHTLRCFKIMTSDQLGWPVYSKRGVYYNYRVL